MKLRNSLVLPLVLLLVHLIVSIACLVTDGKSSFVTNRYHFQLYTVVPKFEEAGSVLENIGKFLSISVELITNYIHIAAQLILAYGKYLVNAGATLFSHKNLPILD